jgi:hypothetical protein
MSGVRAMQGVCSKVSHIWSRMQIKVAYPTRDVRHEAPVGELDARHGAGHAGARDRRRWQPEARSRPRRGGYPDRGGHLPVREWVRRAQAEEDVGVCVPERRRRRRRRVRAGTPCGGGRRGSASTRRASAARCCRDGSTFIAGELHGGAVVGVRRLLGLGAQVHAVTGTSRSAAYSGT